MTLSIICSGVSFHAPTFLKNRSSSYVATKVMEFWVMPYGAPDLFVDQGGEFEGEVNDMFEELSIDSRAVGAHAPWHHGIAERHGGILGNIWNKLIQQTGATGKKELRRILCACVQAKNSTMTRNGSTPGMAVFGRALRWPNNTDDANYELAALGADGEAWKMRQLRSADKVAMVERDASEKLKRSMVRKAPAVQGELLPGTRVYFYIPLPFKGRQRTDFHAWRGPATVIARESHGRYFVAWRARVLSVANAQLRFATAEEAAASEVITEELNITQAFRDKRQYDDVSHGEKPPDSMANRKTRKILLKHGHKKSDRHARRKGKKQPSALENQSGSIEAVPDEPRALQDGEHLEPLGNEIDVAVPYDDDELGRFLEHDSDIAPVVENGNRSVPSSSQGVVEILDRVLDPMNISEDRVVGDKHKPIRGHYGSLDDVPSQARKHFRENPIGQESLATIALVYTADMQNHVWLSQREIDSIGSLISLKVKGVEWHGRVRKALLLVEDGWKGCHRLTVMLVNKEDTIDVHFKDDDGESYQLPEEWKGMTVFYHEKPS